MYQSATAHADGTAVCRRVRVCPAVHLAQRLLNGLSHSFDAERLLVDSLKVRESVAHTPRASADMRT